ncbi:MAG: hypothetical protein KDD31_12305 [Muricauda sp.]|nr:hypothetical protein [Allomuricauda sp.]
MKKALKISVFLFLGLVISCSDDDGSTTTDVNLAGTWDLTEVNVSSAVDVDGDGSSSTNLFDEADCISGTLTIREDMTWSFQQSQFTVTTITNNQYAVQCTGTVQGTGAWANNSTQVQFQGSTLLGILQINGDELVKTDGNDLPGIRSYVYVKR